MSYRSAIDFLETKTKVLELCNDFGARVAVCPEWNGRVMTSTGDGLDGDSFGLINVSEINKGMEDVPYNFFGGEDQLTFSPEGGPFSLYFSFDPEASAIIKHHLSSPRGFYEGAFEVDRAPPAPEIKMRRNVVMTNLAGARFDLDVMRSVRLTNNAEYPALFGEAAAEVLWRPDVSCVSYQTTNTLINRDGTLSKNSGLVSIRIRSMFNSTPNHVVVVPFRTGESSELGPRICVDLFGMAPHGRLRLLPESVILRADGKYRCQLGVSRKRALPFLGAIDFRTGVLSLVAFNLPENPMEHDYLSNEYCETASNTTADFVSTREYYLSETLPDAAEEPPLLERDPEETPYTGEVARAYTNGPAGPVDERTCPFYEFNTFSPALELPTNGSLTHIQHTTHINADRETLEFLLRHLLLTDLEIAYKKLFG